MIIEIKKDDISGDISVLTYKSGKFIFQVGVDRSRTENLFNRVIDAHDTFKNVPILPSIAKKLEESVLVSSVFGTNTIEGGTITEEEIRDLFSENPKMEGIEEEKSRRVLNIKKAYEIADEQAKNNQVVEGEMGIHFNLSEELIIELHRTITDGISHKSNVPGCYRNNVKGAHTRVGDSEHGGVYMPPKCLDDIRELMKVYIEWINSDQLKSLHPIERAHLAHYYFERIHPFFDGNGRVGRVIEATILKCSGMNYAPFALASSYLENIDEYFTVFNQARKLEEQGDKYPNTVFLAFCLDRLRNVFDHLHQNVNKIIGYLLYTNTVDSLLREKKINTRQYTVIHNLLPNGLRHELKDVRTSLWYSGLYNDLTVKTKERDLKKLIELGLIIVDNGRLILSVP